MFAISFQIINLDLAWESGLIFFEKEKRKKKFCFCEKNIKDEDALNMQKLCTYLVVYVFFLETFRTLFDGTLLKKKNSDNKHLIFACTEIMGKYQL